MRTGFTPRFAHFCRCRKIDLFLSGKSALSSAMTSSASSRFAGDDHLRCGMEPEMTKPGDPARIKLRKKPQQERSIQRLDAILEAATDLIVERGIVDMRMTDLAARAGVPIGSLYQFFPEKAAVVRAIFDRRTLHESCCPRIQNPICRFHADAAARGADRQAALHQGR